MEKESHKDLSIVNEQSRYNIYDSKRNAIFCFSILPMQSNCSCDLIASPCFYYNVKVELYKEKVSEILKGLFESCQHTLITSLHSKKQKEVINLFKEIGFTVSGDFKYRSAYNDGDILFLMYTKRKANE